MNTSQKIKKITGLGILIAITIVFGVLGNYVSIGPVNFNLSLVPISIAAILYGPLAGLFVGIVNAIVVLVAPGTAGFLAFNAFGTIVIVLLKTGLAGLISGLLYKLLSKFNFTVAVIISCIIVPLVNTGVFTIGSFTVFSGYLFAGVENPFVYYCLTLIGWNFIFEVTASAVLSPTVVTILKVINKKHNLGI